MNRERVGKLIEENIGLVYKVVSHFYVIKYDRDDLVQAGLMGLQYAIEHFDEELGNKLSTYAIPFIVGSVKKEKELIVDESTKSNNENDYCEVIKNLDKKMQLIYQMKFIEGFTEQKIANHLGINQSTVSRKIKKIIEIIKKTKD